MIYWFVHFHKCMGTSVVKMMENNGCVFPTPTSNGNPSFIDEDDKKRIIGLWNYSEKEWSEYIKKMKRKGWNAFATEFGYPDHLVKEEYDMVSFTVIRNPLKRFISNYNFFVMNNKRKRNISITRFYNNYGVFSSTNFYVRWLSNNHNDLRRGSIKTSLTSQDFNLAVKRLKNMDEVIVQDDPQTFTRFENIGLSKNIPRVNVSHKYYSKNSVFEDVFREENRLDFKLFHIAQNM